MLSLFIITTGLLAWLSKQHVIEYDWTATGRHTLSETSRKLLAKMPEPIAVTSYVREDPKLRNLIKTFVGRYQRHKDNIDLRFINPDTVPEQVRELGISVDGEIIIRYQGRTEHVRSDSEQVFTNALQRLARNQNQWLAFVEGHGERKAQGVANHDLKEWATLLSNQGYRVQPVNLSELKAIPDNTSTLVIASPRVDYLAGEVQQILNYIKAGGNLLWLQEPGALNHLDPLAAMLAIDFTDGSIIDGAGQLIGINDPSIVLISKSLYLPHAITTGFEFTTLFPFATAIEVTAKSEYQWMVKPFLKTGNHTWSETNGLETAVEFNQDTDSQGPLVLGLSLEREIEHEQDGERVTKQQRIVVIGDGDFLSNTYVGNSGNDDLGHRIINWLNSDDEFINIPPKISADTQLSMSGTMLGIIGIGFLFVLPIALLAIGIVIFIRRKKQ